MGGGKQKAAFNAQMAQNAKDQLALQKEQFDYLKAGTPEEQNFRADSADWRKFVAGKNYGAPAPNDILNFDLYSPAHTDALRRQMGNITGIGAAALGGTGDQSLGLQLSREHMVNQAAVDAGASYENAVKAQDAYYKGQALPYAQLTTGTNMGLLNNASQSSQFYTDQQRATLPASFWEIFSPILGGALGAGSAFLGNPAAFGKKG